MNNKGSLIVNGVLGVAIIILFVLQFSSPCSFLQNAYRQ